MTDKIPIYQIVAWDETYENDRSRQRDKCSWCAVPNKQDGLGYRRLIASKNGEAMYAAFLACSLICSKQPRPRQGYLTDNGRPDGVPLTPEDLSLKSGIKISTIESMLELTTLASIGWIRVCQSAVSRALLHSPPSDTVRKGREGKEEKGKEGKEGRTPHGEFGRVKLSKEDYDKLIDKHGPQQTTKAIQVLDDYIESSGKRYKSHYAVLKEGSWVWQRVKQMGVEDVNF